MTDIAAVDGIAGPGLRSTMVFVDVQEITLRLKRKVVEVVAKDGTLTQYDLAAISSMQVSSDGTDLILAVVSQEGIEHDRRKADDDRSKIGANTSAPTAPAGPAKTGTVATTTGSPEGPSTGRK